MDLVMRMIPSSNIDVAVKQTRLTNLKNIGILLAS